LGNLHGLPPFDIGAMHHVYGLAVAKQAIEGDDGG